jgi:hypothetical protein
VLIGAWAARTNVTRRSQLPHWRHTDEFRSLYRRRVAVEREFGRLKTDSALAPRRVCRN